MKKKSKKKEKKNCPHTLNTNTTETPTKKSRDTSIKWSRDKSKMLCLHFHKAYGSQT